MSNDGFTARLYVPEDTTDAQVAGCVEQLGQVLPAMYIRVSRHPPYRCPDCRSDSCEDCERGPCLCLCNEDREPA